MRGAGSSSTTAVNDARVNDRPRAQPMAARRQVRIDLLEQTLAQAVLFQQMPEVQDGGLVGSASVNRSPTKRLTDSTS